MSTDQIEALTLERNLLRKLLKASENAFDALEKMHEELEVQFRFWRQAAEHAVHGWNRLEDKYEQLVEAARGVIEKSGAERAVAWQALEELINDEPAPPEIAMPVADPAPGLHIIEKETPR